jgi:hypothetical protein
MEDWIPMTVCQVYIRMDPYHVTLWYSIFNHNFGAVNCLHTASIIIVTWVNFLCRDKDWISGRWRAYPTPLARTAYVRYL